jgi:GNAT superfamily N-acetyltransferase
LNLEPRHDFTPAEIDWIEDRLYAFNKAAVGREDGDGLGFVVRDEAAEIIGITAGYTWAGVCEIKQMWVDERHRGKGLGRVLLDAMVAEAQRRGVKQIFVASYSFQAPWLYEKAGFERVAAFEGWPEGHVNVILRKSFTE